MDQQIKDMICKNLDVELDKIAKLPSLNDATLNNLHKLTDTKKNLLKIELLEHQLKEKSQEPMMGNSYRYDGYDRGNSYNRPADRYYPMAYGNDMGYSMADVHSHLEAAMREARNEQEREEIRQIMSRYHN